jgi:hypothetical protein
MIIKHSTLLEQSEFKRGLSNVILLAIGDGDVSIDIALMIKKALVKMPVLSPSSLCTRR